MIVVPTPYTLINMVVSIFPSKGKKGSQNAENEKKENQYPTLKRKPSDPKSSDPTPRTQVLQQADVEVAVPGSSGPDIHPKMGIHEDHVGIVGFRV